MFLACIRTLFFLWPSDTPSYRHTTFCSLLSLWMSGYCFGCYKSRCCTVFVWMYIFISVVYIPRSRMVGQMDDCLHS